MKNYLSALTIKNARNFRKRIIKNLYFWLWAWLQILITIFSDQRVTSFHNWKNAQTWTHFQVYSTAENIACYFCVFVDI